MYTEGILVTVFSYFSTQTNVSGSQLMPFHTRQFGNLPAAAAAATRRSGRS